MKDWRFRAGYGGALVLQRLIEDHDAQGGHRWRDANVEDLCDYYKHVL